MRSGDAEASDPTPSHGRRPVLHGLMSSAESASPSLKVAFAGASCTFSGLGLARFTYVPLFPAMVAAGWVSGAEAGLLGALNFAGYVVGTLSGRAIGRALGTPRALDLGMALVVLSFVGCGWNGGVAWLVACRAVAGIAGGILMVLAGPAVQAMVAPERRGIAGGIVLTGVGSGALAGSLVAPALLRTSGVSLTWLGLGLTVFCVWMVARRAWPTSPVVVVSGRLPAGTTRLALSYGFSAAGLVPHMVYLADLLVRGRGFSIEWGAAAFLAFALGGFLGPLAGGRVADRIGAERAYRIWIGIQVVGVLLLFVPWLPLLLLGGFLGGFASIGLTAVTLTRTREIAGAASGAAWARTTLAFATAQALTGLLLAALFSVTHSHDHLVAVALVFSLAAFIPVSTRSAASARTGA